MPSILKHVVCKHLRPSRFLQSFLLGNAPEIVIRENSHAGEIQMPSQAPSDLGSNVAQTELGCFVRENDTKEDRPLAAPVLADFVSDAHHVGRETSLDLVDRGLNLRLLRNCDGHAHSYLSLPLRTST